MKSTQLIEIVSIEQVKLGKNNTPGGKIEYKRLDGESPTGQVMKAQYLIGKVDTTALAGLHSGDRVVMEKEKNGEYWNVTGFKPASDWKDRPKKEFTAGAAKSDWKAKDDTPLRVGTARNTAIAFLSANKPKGFTWEDVNTEAKKSLRGHQELEDWVRSGKDSEPSSSTPDLHGASMDQDDEIPF